MNICNHRACNKRIPFRDQYCEEHQEQKSTENYQRDVKKQYKCREWKHLYDTRAWKTRRRKQLTKQPLCESCLAEGRTTLATVADHIQDHKGDTVLFYDGELQSLCASCHSKKTIREQQERKIIFK